MAILLTGGAGFIGSHTAVACLNAGVEVVLADNFSNSSPKVLDRIEKITGKRPALYNVDVCDKQALRGIFAEQSITGVVHFAGLKAVGESVRLPPAYRAERARGHAGVRLQGVCLLLVRDGLR